MKPPHGPPTYLNAARRERELNALSEGETVDVLVIGGGVTGAGVALDAQTRGLTTALLERRDLATGTSRWSSKLAHGGLRYLAQGHPSVAWESARERHHLATYIAPHLIRALPQLSPPSPLIETGVRLGDAMRALAGTSRKRLPCARRISAEEARRWAPALAPEHGQAILHWDGQLEDDARLVIAIARTAAGHGAKILTYTEVDAITATGVSAHDALTGRTFEVRARRVINATGVWAGRLVGGIRLKPSRGSHVLIDAGRLGDPRASVNIPIPGHFGRFVFAIPRPDGLVMIGLTDDPHESDDLPDAPQPTHDDIRFLLETASTAFGTTPLTEQDVVGSFSGLRPLLASADQENPTSDISRAHQVIADPDTNAVTIVGGKLTTYRRMAQDAVDAITDRRCVTERLPLVGAGEKPTGAPPRLIRRFGSEAAELARGDTDPIAPGVPALNVELQAAVEREGAMTAADVLDIRTRLGLVPAWREQALAAAEEAVYAISSSRPTISSA
jgi:glycerol-3-phosphate dehydrogenase